MHRPADLHGNQVLYARMITFIRRCYSKQCNCGLFEGRNLINSSVIFERSCELAVYALFAARTQSRLAAV